MTADTGYRERFSNRSLIFASDSTENQPQWLRMDHCIWSTATDIRGKASLATQYPSLREFFVNTLGVRTLNLPMLYDALLSLSPQHTTVAETKGQLWSFNSLLGTDTLTAGQTPSRLA